MAKIKLLAAIEAPIHDYVDGWYDKDAERMQHGLHPDLAKRHMNQGAPNGLEELDLATLLTLLPQYGGTTGDERRLDIDVQAIEGDIACAKVTSNDYVDYVALGRREDGWQIINTLWRFANDGSHADAGSDLGAVRKPVLDYVEGWYDKDTARMAAGLHPALAKRSMNPEAPQGIDHLDLPTLLGLVPQYGGQTGNERKEDITVLDVDHDMASVRVVSNNYVDLLHLGYWNDQWWVINVLWKFRDQD